MDLERQQMMTLDNISLDVDIVLRYKIIDPFKAMFELAKLQTTIIQYAYTTMRSLIGTHHWQDVLAHKDEMAKKIAHAVMQNTVSWGVQIDAIDIKDVRLPRALESTLSAAAVAERTAAAKLISARADVQAAELMRQASDALNTPAAMQIRYLDNITKLATSQNAKIVFIPTSAPELPALHSQITVNEYNL